MTFPADPCSSCPRVVEGLDGPCWSQRASTRHVCESIASGDRGFLPLVLETSIVKVEPPGLLSQALSFAEAVVTHIVDGRPKTSPEALAERLTICRACPNIRHDESCVLCGCLMPWKASWADMNCPEGRWPPALESEPPPQSIEEEAAFFPPGELD